MSCPFSVSTEEMMAMSKALAFIIYGMIEAHIWSPCIPIALKIESFHERELLFLPWGKQVLFFLLSGWSQVASHQSFCVGHSQGAWCLGRWMDRVLTGTDLAVDLRHFPVLAVTNRRLPFTLIYVNECFPSVKVWLTNFIYIKKNKPQSKTFLNSGQIRQ